MVIKNKLSTKKHLILALLCFLLNSSAILSMNSYPEQSQASCSYAQEESIDRRFWLTSDIINKYRTQLASAVQQAQTNPTAEALNTISDLYFYAQFTQDSDKEIARETISPIINTLIDRHNDQALSELAYIFVGTRHAPRINQFVQNRMATRNTAREAPPLNRNRLTAATVIGGGILGLYLWHRYTKNSR